MKDLKNDITENKHSILHNKHCIEQNKEAIVEIKQGCTNKCVPQSVFAEVTALSRRLIIALCITVSILFLSNVLWIVVWSTRDSGKRETTIITNDGTSNVVGNNGSIQGGE